MREINAEPGRELEQYIRSIPDFPVEGILFRDITPLLAEPVAVQKAVDAMLGPFDRSSIDAVAGIEARGFIFGALIAYRMDKPFIPVRKEGKLPFETFRIEYDLEYGKASLELHRDAVPEGGGVLLVDDLLATGGTMRAAAELIEKAGGRVAGATYLIELKGLRGRDRLRGVPIHSVIQYD